MNENTTYFLRAVAASLLASVVGFTAAMAQDESPATGWSHTAELSLVVTAGNSETETIGFKSLSTRRWERSILGIRAGGIRAESTTVDRTAFGPDTMNFSVTEVENTAKTAENYYLTGRYDRNITDRLFWYTSLGWDRNRFAGIDNRYVAAAGVGNIWRDGERVKFRTDYALTYTDQEDVVENPMFNDTFAGLRLSYSYENVLTESTTFLSSLIVDQNLDETDDWRADMINSVSVTMTQKLALKASLQWLYDHEPSFESVPLFDTPGGALLGTVPAQLDELDTVFTTSLVINF